MITRFAILGLGKHVYSFVFDDVLFQIGVKLVVVSAKSIISAVISTDQVADGNTFWDFGD